MFEKPFRSHISIALEETGKAAWLLLIILLTNMDTIFTAVREKNLSSFQGNLILTGTAGVFLLLFFKNLWRWYRTEIILTEETLTVERKTLNRKKLTIGRDTIATVNLTRNLLQRIIGTCRVKIDTNSATTARTTDVSFVLKKGAAAALRQVLLPETGEEREGGISKRGFAGTGRPAGTAASAPAAEERPAERKDVFSGEAGKEAAVPMAGQGSEQKEPASHFLRFGRKRSLLHGLLSLPVAGTLLALAVSAGTLASFTVPELRSSFQGGALRGLAATAVAAAPMIWGGLKELLQCYDMTLSRSAGKIRAESGLLTRRSYTIPLEKISGYVIRKTALSRLFGWASLSVIAIGGGEGKTVGSQTVIPMSPEKELESHLTALLPELMEKYRGCRPAAQPAAALPSLWVRSLLIHGSIGLFLFGMGFFQFRFVLPEALRFWELPAAAAVAVLLGVSAALWVLLGHKNRRIWLGTDLAAFTSGIFALKTVLIPYGKIQMLSLKNGPVLRACRVRKGNLSILAAPGERTREAGIFEEGMFALLEERLRKAESGAVLR